MSHAGVGCPHLAGLDPVSPAMVADPYPTWERARSRSPVVYIPMIDRYLALSYDGVRAILRDTDAFSSSDVIELGDVPDELRARLPHGFPIQYPALINTDPPRHTAIRKLTQQAFTVKRVNAMEPAIRELADRLADGFAGADRVDLMADYAVPLSTITLSRMLGIPDEHEDRFRRFADVIVELTSMVVRPERRLELSRAAAEFYEYVEGLVAERRTAPRDDLLTALLEAKDPDDGSVLSEQSVISIGCQLIVAGHETTSTLVGNMVWLLLEDRRRWDAVCRDPRLVEPAVEESLRRASPIKHLTRTVKDDIEVDGVRVPAGARILVGFGAANMDPRHFADPHEFDLEREGPSPHVAFGRGTHFCLGAPLARLEARVALETLVRRTPDLRPSSGEPPERKRALSVYAFSRLPLAFTPDRRE